MPPGSVPRTSAASSSASAPAPFTGLRAGLVTARRSPSPRGARLIGQNILDPQDAMLRAALRGDTVIADAAGFLADVSHTAQNGQADGRPEPEHHITLCVNDARRKQLYFSLNHEAGVTGSETDSCHWIAMDIDYPGHIVERVNAEVRRRAEIGGMRYIVDVVGHGAARYADAWQSLDALGSVVEGSILDAGGGRPGDVRRDGAETCGRRSARRTAVSAPARCRSTQPAQTRAEPCWRAEGGLMLRELDDIGRETAVGADKGAGS